MIARRLTQPGPTEAHSPADSHTPLTIVRDPATMPIEKADFRTIAAPPSSVSAERPAFGHLKRLILDIEAKRFEQNTWKGIMRKVDTNDTVAERLVAEQLDRLALDIERLIAEAHDLVDAL